MSIIERPEQLTTTYISTQTDRQTDRKTVGCRQTSKERQGDSQQEKMIKNKRLPVLLKILCHS